MFVRPIDTVQIVNTDKMMDIRVDEPDILYSTENGTYYLYRGEDGFDAVNKMAEFMAAMRDGVPLFDFNSEGL